MFNQVLRQTKIERLLWRAIADYHRSSLVMPIRQFSCDNFESAWPEFILPRLAPKRPNEHRGDRMHGYHVQRTTKEMGGKRANGTYYGWDE
jgi:hypothetical protein